MSRAVFEVGREPQKDDGLRQVEADDALRAWAARLPEVAARRRITPRPVAPVLHDEPEAA